MRFFFILLVSLFLLSCTSVKMSVDVPVSMNEQYGLVKVSGVKGKMLPGASRPLRFESHFKAVFRDGWNVSSDIFDKTPGGFFSEESFKRSFLLNFGIGINDVVSKTADKFNFTIEDSSQSFVVTCHQLYLGKSKNYKIRDIVDYSKRERQVSNFSAILNSRYDTAVKPWLLKLGYDSETPKGIIATTLREGMAVDEGVITNLTDTIQIKPLFIKKATSPKGNFDMLFPVIGGYEFITKEKVIGWVDLYATSIGFSNSITKSTQLIVAAASTAILLRNR